MNFDSIDTAIERNFEHALSFLEALVAARSDSGSTEEAQRLLAAELERIGFETTRIPVPQTIGLYSAAGSSPGPNEGRSNVLATRPGHERSSLLLNGHIDTVPATETALWTSDPFESQRREGRLYGRGAGDMKGGFAMATLALGALNEAAPGVLDNPIGLLSAIEEESTGNGTLASLKAGVVPDQVVVCEPTGLDLLISCPGVVWVEIRVSGKGGHAEGADGAGNPVEEAMFIHSALHEFVEELNVTVNDDALLSLGHPYNLNLGRIEGGDWPSSVPASATLEGRVGFPRSWTTERAFKEIEGVIAAAVTRSEWLSKHSPQVRASGLQARGYSLPLNHPLARSLYQAHEETHGSPPSFVAMAATTDARHYINDFDVPAICYGPRVGGMHGVDEFVDLDSIASGARTLTRFIANYFSEESNVSE